MTVKHQLQKIDCGQSVPGGSFPRRTSFWRCATCNQQWKSKPRSVCPGVPVYDWSNRPKNTTSCRDLEIQNRKPVGSPVGVIGSGKSNWVYLYDSEEYAHWLSERDRYVEIFEQNREVIQAGQLRAKEAKLQMRDQMSRCFQCASGCATPQGFLCVIFPTGLEAHQIPCVEWSPRNV